MQLSVFERITLLQILPKGIEGTYLTIKIIIDLKMQLAFSEKEFKDYGIIEHKDKRVTWKKSGFKEVQIGEKATEIICEVLKKIDEDGKVNEQNITLFEKFIKT